MRWIKRQKSEPKIVIEPQLGDKRIRNRFLWFPICIGSEYRWLERTVWSETYENYVYLERVCGTIQQKNKWIPKQWINL